MNNPDESVKAALDALDFYLRKSDSVIEWLKSNLKAPAEDFREVLEGMLTSSPLGDAQELSSTKDYGEFFEENVLKLLDDKGKISTSILQRKFSVGYGRAAQMIDTLSEKGYVVHTENGWVKNII